MATVQGVSDANREELRGRLAGRVALLPLIGASGIALWVLVTSTPISATALGVLGILAGLGLGLIQMVAKRSALARHVAVWSFTAGLLVAMALIPDGWLPFAGLMLVFVGGMLVSGGQVAIASAIGVWAAWLNWQGLRAYPLSQLLIALALDSLEAEGKSVADIWNRIYAVTAFFVFHEFLFDNGDRVVGFLRNFRELFPGVPLILFEAIRPTFSKMRRRPSALAIQYFLLHDLSMQNPVSREEWKALFSQAGFSSISERYLGFARTAIYTLCS